MNRLNLQTSSFVFSFKFATAGYVSLAIASVSSSPALGLQRVSPCVLDERKLLLTQKECLGLTNFIPRRWHYKCAHDAVAKDCALASSDTTSGDLDSSFWGQNDKSCAPFFSSLLLDRGQYGASLKRSPYVFRKHNRTASAGEPETQWREMPGKLPVGAPKIAAVTIRGGVVRPGGKTVGGPVAEVTLLWMCPNGAGVDRVSLPAKPAPCANVAAVVLDGHVYVAWEEQKGRSLALSWHQKVRTKLAGPASVSLLNPDGRN
jgi:hypothetical protein